MEIARRHDVAVMIHDRDARADVVRVLDDTVVVPDPIPLAAPGVAGATLLGLGAPVLLAHRRRHRVIPIED